MNIYSDQAIYKKNKKYLSLKINTNNLVRSNRPIILNTKAPLVFYKFGTNNYRLQTSRRFSIFRENIDFIIDIGSKEIHIKKEQPKLMYSRFLSL